MQQYSKYILQPSKWIKVMFQLQQINEKSSHAVIIASSSKYNYKSKGENTIIPYAYIQTHGSNTKITGLFNKLNTCNITHTTSSGSYNNHTIHTYEHICRHFFSNSILILRVKIRYYALPNGYIQYGKKSFYLHVLE